MKLLHTIAAAMLFATAAQADEYKYPGPSVGVVATVLLAFKVDSTKETVRERETEGELRIYDLTKTATRELIRFAPVC